MSRRLHRRATAALTGLLIVALAGVISAPGAAAQSSAPIAGGGSSFVQLMLEQWRADTARPPYSLKVDYSAAGSTFGREKYMTGQLDFGASDIPFQTEELGRVRGGPRGNFVYVPVVAGGLGFMFNVTGKDGQRIGRLNLSQRTVCRLFTEEEIFWDDPEIVADNPGVPLPRNRVRPVVRSDGSGTSYVLSEYCIATAPDVWGRFISMITTRFSDKASVELRQGLPTSNWPFGFGSVSGAFASDGVANAVANGVSGADTVTYVEVGAAKLKGFPVAHVRNGAGAFAYPDASAVTTALAYAKGRPDGTFILEYLRPDAAAYFPSTYSYVISQTTGFDPGKGRSLATFLYYAVTAGQRKAEQLGYARLSDVLVNLALDKASQIPGAPDRPTDTGGAPPPPRPIDVPAGGGGAGGGGAAGAAGGGGAGAGAAGAASRAAGTAGAAAAGPAGAAAQAGAAKSAAKPGTKAAGTATTVAGAVAGAPGPEAAAPGAVDPAATATGAASTEALRSEDGSYKLDVSNLPEAAPAAATAAAVDPVSDKQVLWLLAAGALAVFMRAATRGSSGIRSSRKEAGA